MEGGGPVNNEMAMSPQPRPAMIEEMEGRVGSSCFNSPEQSKKFNSILKILIKKQPSSPELKMIFQLQKLQILTCLVYLNSLLETPKRT